MLRFLAVALAGAFVLGVGSTQGRLSRGEYLAALNAALPGSTVDRLEAQVVDFDLPGGWPTRSRWLGSERRLRAQLEESAAKVQKLRPPAEVAQAHADYIASLRFCGRLLARLERSSPLDAVIVEREMQPCFAAHRKACDEYYARGYSFG